MSFAAPLRRQKTSAELLQYANLLARRGSEEESEGHLEIALKYYKLARRHQREWMQRCAEDEPADFVLVSERLDALKPQQEVLSQAKPSARPKIDETAFLASYPSTKPQEKKSASKQPWRAPSRRASIPCAIKRRPRRRAKSKNPKPPPQTVEDDLRVLLLDELTTTEHSLNPVAGDRELIQEDVKAILEKKDLQIQMLTRQLEEAGCTAVTEAIPLAEAKARLQDALKALENGDESAEAEMEKMSILIDNHPEQIDLLRKQHEEWLAETAPICADALALSSSFVPPEVLARGTSKAELARTLPNAVASRVYSTPALWLLRAPPDFIARIHEADLRGKFGYQGLDLVELHALWATVKDIDFENDNKNKKAEWRDGLVDRLKRWNNAQLPASKRRHPAYPNDPGPFDPEAPVLPVCTSSATSTSAAPAIDDAVLNVCARPAVKTSTDLDTSKVSVVSLAKQQLARSSTFHGASKEEKKQNAFVLSSSQRQATQRRRATISAPASSENLMSELKSSLLRRRQDDDGEKATTTASLAPGLKREANRKSIVLAKTGGKCPVGKAPDFASELKRLAAERATKRAEQKAS